MLVSSIARKVAFVALALAVAAVVASGCRPATRPEEPTYPVSGTVTLDGKPMPDGEIIFKDTAKGLVHTIPIKDGRFEGQASAGTKRVEIYAYKIEVDPAAKEMYGDQAQPTKINIIPAKYNAESTMTANVEATKEPGKNNFSFEVTSQ